MEKLPPAGGGRKGLGKKVVKRTERDRSAGSGGHDPCRSGFLLSGSTQGLPCQTGLSHTRGAGKDDAGPPSGDRLGEIGEFRLPAEQRPILRSAHAGWILLHSVPSGWPGRSGCTRINLVM